jgi:NAD(P)H-dependent FMN reductase
LHAIALSGSLRSGSLNTRLCTAMAACAPAGVRIDVGTLHDIPLYDGDVEDRDGVPSAVTALRDRIRAADALIIVTPEYNAGMPGVLKNGLDWLSRPPEAIGEVFAGRPTALAGATPGGLGTTLAQAGSLVTLRQFKLRLYPDHLRVSRAHEQLDDDGRASDELAATLRRWLAGLQTFAAAGGA